MTFGKMEGIRCVTTEPFDYPELEVLRMPPVQNKTCPQCGTGMAKSATFCSRSCVGKFARRKQLAWEQSVAQKMEQEGWEIISPTACCDRIGIKDGRVFFLEFKPEEDSSLRSFQKAVRKAAPHMYRIVVGTSEGGIHSIRGDGRRSDRNHHMHRRKRSKGASSRFLGVSYSKHNDRWRAKLTVKGKFVHLGYFTTEEEAARVYKDEVQRRRGEDVIVEFCGPVCPEPQDDAVSC